MRTHAAKTLLPISHAPYQQSTTSLVTLPTRSASNLDSSAAKRCTQVLPRSVLECFWNVKAQKVVAEETAKVVGKLASTVVELEDMKKRTAWIAEVDIGLIKTITAVDHRG